MSPLEDQCGARHSSPGPSSQIINFRLSDILAIWQITGPNSDFLSLFLYPNIGRESSLQFEVISIDSGCFLPSEIELRYNNS